jgi:hypothetical protein
MTFCRCLVLSLLKPAVRKFGWAMSQPAASMREVMTKESYTPPPRRSDRSSLEAGFTNRAIVRDEPQQGIFRVVAFGDRDQWIGVGLVLPTAGRGLQDERRLELKPGSRPLLWPYRRAVAHRRWSPSGCHGADENSKCKDPQQD